MRSSHVLQVFFVQASNAVPLQLGEPQAHLCKWTELWWDFPKAGMYGENPKLDGSPSTGDIFCPCPRPVDT